MSTTDTTPTATVEPLTWSDLEATVNAAGGGVFLATTGADGRPHVAWVVPGWQEGRLWVATFASSQKGANLRHSTAVAMTCAATPETNLLIRATARLVDDPAEATQRWNEPVVPYDLGAFFSGPDDPETLFVELVVDSASIHPLGPGPTRRWTPA